MRKTVIFAAFVAAMGAASCQRAEVKEVSTSFTFGIQQPESQTKTDLYGVNEIHWTTGDQISIQCADREVFTLSSGAGTKVGTFSVNKDVTISDNTLVIYPASLSPNWETTDKAGWHITLPDTYEWSSRGLKAPMMAYISFENPSWQGFKMVTGALKVDIYDIPANANKLVFTAPGKRVSGLFRLHEAEGTEDIVAEDGDVNNTITITFEAGTATSRTFFIPLPVGTYTNFTLQMYEDATPISGTGRRSTVSVAVRKVHYLPSFSYGATDPELVLWEGEKFLGDSWNFNISDISAAAFATAKTGQTITIYGTTSAYADDEPNNIWTYRAIILSKLNPWSILTDGNKSLAWGADANQPFEQSAVLTENDVTDLKAGGMAITGTRVTVTKVTLK